MGKFTKISDMIADLLFETLTSVLHTTEQILYLLSHDIRRCPKKLTMTEPEHGILIRPW